MIKSIHKNEYEIISKLSQSINVIIVGLASNTWLVFKLLDVHILAGAGAVPFCGKEALDGRRGRGLQACLGRFRRSIEAVLTGQLRWTASYLEVPSSRDALSVELFHF